MHLSAEVAEALAAAQEYSDALYRVLSKAHPRHTAPQGLETACTIAFRTLKSVREAISKGDEAQVIGLLRGVPGNARDHDSVGFEPDAIEAVSPSYRRAVAARDALP